MVQRNVPVLSRLLAETVARDVAENEDYDPEADRRVLWAREVLADARARPVGSKPIASAALEACMEVVLLPEMAACGRAAAAGV